MSVTSVPGRVGTSSGRRSSWAIRLSVAAAVVFAAPIATVAVAYAVGGEGAVEDTWLGALLAAVAAVGLLGSAAAFVLAVVARIGRERPRLLWLPLSVFPAAVLLLVVAEAFVLE